MDKRVDREDKSLLIGKRNKDVFSLELMTWVPSFKDLATWPTESSLCTGALQAYSTLRNETKRNEMVLCETVLCEMVLCEMVLCETVLCEMVLCETVLCETVTAQCLRR